MFSYLFYVALTFWLMVGLLEAYGIFKLWEGVVRPRWINLVLLPGTVVAETAHFVAALLTGSPVREAKLVSDESVGQPAGSNDPKGIPVLSPLLLALLPIVAGVAIIYVLYRAFDGSVVTAFAASRWFAAPVTSQLAQELTWRLGGWFDLARNLLSLAERLIRALPATRTTFSWQGWLFVYLTACLAIRMVPLRRNLRGGMAAIVLVGLLATGLGRLSSGVDKGLHDAWPLLAYVIALLTALLLLALLVRGLVALIFALADRPQPRRQSRHAAGPAL